MKRRLELAMVCALLLGTHAFAASQGNQNQPPRRFAWWRSEQFQKSLGLTFDQVNRIENLFQAALPELRKGRDDLDRLEAELSRLIETNADESVVTRKLDKVEAARSQLNKTRTLLMLHHRQVLTPEQRVKYTALVAQMQGSSPPSTAPSDRGSSDKDRSAKPTDQKP